jgi:hypothetical protein
MIPTAAIAQASINAIASELKEGIVMDFMD